MPEVELSLVARGFTLDEIWDGLIEQIALYGEQQGATAEMTVDERLARQEKIRKLEKQIAKTEAAAWKEQQSKKQFALYQKLQEYKKELEELKHG